MKISRRVKTLAIFCTLALALAACSSDDSSEAEEADTDEVESDDSTEDSSEDDTSSASSVEYKTGTLAESEYYGDYELDDGEYGSSVQVTLSDTERVMTGNGLPNHDVGTFPNDGNPNTISEQEISATFPLVPTFTGEGGFAKEPGRTISGVKLDPQTAERANCENGVNYSLEAIQDVVDLGLDFNNAHVQPTGAYHYHGVSEELVNTIDPDQDIVHVGFAYDGFMIYYSKSGQYSPSYQLIEDEREGVNCTYEDRSSGETITFDSVPDGSFVEDWEFVESAGDLDECNGIEIDGEYAYFMTDTYPYIGRCLNGEYTDQRAGGGEEPTDTEGEERREGREAPEGDDPESEAPEGEERPEGGREG